MAVLDPIRDFEPDKLLQSHDKDISSLVDRVSAIEQKLSNPEQLAQTLEAATSDSKKLDKLFSKLFCNMMKNDDEVKTAVQDKINALDRRAVAYTIKKFGGKLGFAIWSIFLIGITVLFTKWIEHLFSGK